MMKKSKFSYSRIYYPTPKTKEGFYISGKSIKFFLLILAIAGIVYFIFISSFFKLKNIIIEGEVDDNFKTEILKYKDKNIFLVSQEQLEKQIRKEHPIFKSTKVYKGLPDSMKITIEKRNRYLIWMTGGKYYSLDDTGLIYESLVELPAENKIPIIEDRKNVPYVLGQKVVVAEFVNFAQKASEMIPVEVEGIKITNLGVEESTYHLFLKTDLGWQIILDVSRSLEEQVDDLNLIVSNYKDQIHEYVDLRLKGRAYYK